MPTEVEEPAETPEIQRKKELAAKAKARERLGALIGAMAATATLAALSGLAANIWHEQQSITGISLHRVMEMNDRLSALQSKVVEIQNQIQLTRQLSDKINKAQPATLQIAKLTVQLDSLQAQVRLLNDAIGQSPDKALAVPLLRKDMDNLKDSYHHDLDNTQAEINRVYDQNKWFIGLMFTMALGLLGLAVSNFLQLRKS